MGPSSSLSCRDNTRPDSDPATARKATVQRPSAGTVTGGLWAGSSSIRNNMRQSPTLNTSPARNKAFSRTGRAFT